MSVWVVIVPILLLLVAHPCKAIVDPHQYKCEEVKAAITALRAYADTYYADRTNLLNHYTGPCSQECKEQVEGTAGYTVIVNTNFLRNIVKMQEIDKKCYAKLEACDGDRTCISNVHSQTEAELVAFQQPLYAQFAYLKYSNLCAVKNILDCCVPGSPSQDH